MKTQIIKFGTTLLILPATLFIFISCSSTSSPAPGDAPIASAPAAAPAAPSQPVFLGTGVSANAASGMVYVDSIDYSNRTCVLSWPDGTRMDFKVGPEYVNFDQIKAGDSLMSTVTKSYVAYLVPGGVPMSAVTNLVAQTMPAGSQAGGVMIRTVDYHAQVLEVNNATRGVVLRYGVDEAKYVKADPGVNLALVQVNDFVFVRTTAAVAVAVVPR